MRYIVSARESARVNAMCAVLATRPMVITQNHISGVGHVQTKSAGTSATGVISKVWYTTRLPICSLRVRIFSVMTDSAMVRAETTTMISPTPTDSTPGRRMMSIPAKPMISAVMRRARMTSPSTTTAATAANKGAVNPRATALPRGTMASALNQVAMDTKPRNVRRPRRPGRRVCRTPTPRRTSQGIIAAKPNKQRKKTISSGCSSVEACRIIAFMHENSRPANMMSSAALTGSERPAKPVLRTSDIAAHDSTSRSHPRGSPSIR